MLIGAQGWLMQTTLIYDYNIIIEVDNKIKYFDSCHDCADLPGATRQVEGEGKVVLHWWSNHYAPKHSPDMEIPDTLYQLHQGLQNFRMSGNWNCWIGMALASGEDVHLPSEAAYM